MNVYRRESIRSALLIALCCLVGAAALLGIGRMVWTVVYNARNVSYRQSLLKSVDYAALHNSMTVSLDGGEPVKISFRRAKGFGTYFLDTPSTLPASQSRALERRAVVDCGDGSTIELWDAGDRLMRIRYLSPGGKRYSYTLQYHTVYDGWDGFLRIVSGEYQPA